MFSWEVELGGSARWKVNVLPTMSLRYWGSANSWMSWSPSPSPISWDMSAALKFVSLVISLSKAIILAVIRIQHIHLHTVPYNNHCIVSLICRACESWESTLELSVALPAWNIAPPISRLNTIDNSCAKELYFLRAIQCNHLKQPNDLYSFVD